MQNPFESIEKRLTSIEDLLAELKYQYYKQEKGEQKKIVDLKKLVELRPILGSISSIYKKTHKGEIPFHKLGSKLLFNLEEIDAWLLSSKPNSIEEEVDATLKNLK